MRFTIEHRSALLGLIRDGHGFESAVSLLLSMGAPQLGHMEWSLWKNFYEPIVRNNKILELELIRNGRSLSWFARELNQRRKRVALS